MYLTRKSMLPVQTKRHSCIEEHRTTRHHAWKDVTSWACQDLRGHYSHFLPLQSERTPLLRTGYSHLKFPMDKIIVHLRSSENDSEEDDRGRGPELVNSKGETRAVGTPVAWGRHRSQQSNQQMRATSCREMLGPKLRRRCLQSEGNGAFISQIAEEAPNRHRRRDPTAVVVREYRPNQWGRAPT